MQYKAKKYLGQNFLKSKIALQKICDAGEINQNDTILEIGPGKGVLTEKLLEKSGKVIAIEKDKDLVEILTEKFSNEIKNQKLILVNEDILDVSLNKFINRNEKYKIIANIPYNITGAIFKKFLSEELQPEKMVLLVQKEVAERIVSKDKKESILSLSVKVYGNPKYIMTVSKRFFSPSPKVDSAIILINNISRKNFRNSEDEEKFFNLIKNGFAHKRKMLVNNLRQQKNIPEIFKELEISNKSRAEDLNLEKWLEISEKLVR